MLEFQGRTKQGRFNTSFTASALAFFLFCCPSQKLYAQGGGISSGFGQRVSIDFGDASNRVYSDQRDTKMLDTGLIQRNFSEISRSEIANHEFLNKSRGCHNVSNCQNPALLLIERQFDTSDHILEADVYLVETGSPDEEAQQFLVVRGSGLVQPPPAQPKLVTNRPGFTNGYALRLDRNEARLLVFVAGSGIGLGSAIMDPAVRLSTTPKRYLLKAEGSTISFSVDGVEYLSVQDNTITTGRHMGFSLDARREFGNDVDPWLYEPHLDNILAQDVGFEPYQSSSRQPIFGDDFDRTDGSVGNGWMHFGLNGAMSISSNQLLAEVTATNHGGIGGFSVIYRELELGDSKYVRSKLKSLPLHLFGDTLAKVFLALKGSGVVDHTTSYLPANCYFAELVTFSPSGRTLNLGKNLNGSQVVLASTAVGGFMNQYAEIEFQLESNQLRVVYDGSELLTVTDTDNDMPNGDTVAIHAVTNSISGVGEFILMDDIEIGSLSRDDDGDGFLPPEDCDDTDPEINPNSVEVCDGVDNDCSGAVDEGFDADRDDIADCFDACPFDAGNDVDGDEVCGDLDVCEETVIPERVPTNSLGVSRFALIDAGTEFDTRSPPGGGNGPGLSFTTGDTAGCSCEQIIEALELGNGHVKFGCSISAMEAWVALINP